MIAQREKSLDRVAHIIGERRVDQLLESAKKELFTSASNSSDGFVSRSYGPGGPMSTTHGSSMNKNFDFGYQQKPRLQSTQPLNESASQAAKASIPNFIDVIFLKDNRRVEPLEIKNFSQNKRKNSVAGGENSPQNQTESSYG